MPSYDGHATQEASEATAASFAVGALSSQELGSACTTRRSGSVVLGEPQALAVDIGRGAEGRPETHSPQGASSSGRTQADELAPGVDTVRRAPEATGTTFAFREAASSAS